MHEENISIYTKCIYKCVHEEKKNINMYEEEGYSTRIITGGLATWPSHHLPFRFFFFYLPYQLPDPCFFLGQQDTLGGENKLKISLKWQKMDVYTRWSL